MIESSDIEIIEGSEMNSINCVKAINTLQHKDYCCPFCSHGETIQLKVFSQYNGRIRGSYRRAYLECSEGCMSIGLYEKSSQYHMSYEDILKEGIEVFKKLIPFTKDRIDFILV